ncbi:MAG: tRNA (adenosine(37)-N6)-dimethylallyltransferase MiaA [Tannerellaceae bacterium]|nr:tRNA (adenosine(37)-N6)-dimethylallyltransferase MiaA [Tannerellaceae bacterium]
MKNTLIILAGPTGVGKTELSLRIAQHFDAPIISSDSRQIYKDIPIGTAAPSLAQRKQVKHYLTGILELTDYYSAAHFETDVLSLLEKLYKTVPVVLLSGGSMMYIDAVCKGIDDIPSITPNIREEIYQQYENEGLQPILEELKKIDPLHYERVDRQNYKRVIHAVEVCRTTGKPYSTFRTNNRKERPFRMIKIGLNRNREELYERINRRVEEMIASGFIDEARRVYPYKRLNALNTVGYKEIFQYLDGHWTLDFAVEKIKRNTRIYARKQMTWFRQDEDIAWFHPDNEAAILKHIHALCDAGAT